MTSRALVFFLLFAGVVITGCGDEPAPQADQPAPSPQTERERMINNTQAVSVVGYDGAGVKRVVDNMVKTSDAQQAALKEAAQAADQTEPEAAQ